ncbi:MAG: hypothetical protein ACLPKB_24425 [Xanthobacteraceae bacterium]
MPVGFAAGAFLHRDDDSAAVGTARGQAGNQRTGGLMVDTGFEYEFAPSFGFGPSGGLVANKGATVLGLAVFRY